MINYDIYYVELSYMYIMLNYHNYVERSN